MTMSNPNYMILRAPIFFIFFFFWTRCEEDDPQYVQCKQPFNCGNRLTSQMYHTLPAARAVIVLLSVIAVIVRCIKIRRISERQRMISVCLGAFIQNNGPLAVQRYNFLDIRKMTNSFQDKLGKGG